MKPSLIPLVKPIIGEAERAALLAVLDSGQLAQGPRVAEFEQRFATHCGVRYAVAVNSGTAALHTALSCLGVGPGDEVITVPFTFVATANAILMQGARPRFVDIEPDTFTINPDAVAAAITPRTKAIIAVDLFGQPFRQELNKIAQQHNIPLVEDACQAVGAARDGLPAGSLGTIGAFSFYATKNITTGEGGMLTTNDETVAARARRFRHHGQGTQYLYETMGYNYRMTDLQAALGIEQLKHLADWTRRRQAHAAFLTSALAGIPGLKLPVILGDSQHAFHQYTIRVTKACACTRDELRRHLEQRGVESAIFYPKPLHLHPHFASLGYREGAFPEAERAAAEVLSLPVHPGLTHKQLERIATAVREATTC